MPRNPDTIAVELKKRTHEEQIQYLLAKIAELMAPPSPCSMAFIERCRRFRGSGSGRWEFLADDLAVELAKMRQAPKPEPIMCDDCGKKPAVNHTCYRCGVDARHSSDGAY